MLVLVGTRQSPQFWLKAMSETHHRDELEAVISEIVDATSTTNHKKPPWMAIRIVAH
jgi:hypothetical protein